MKTSRQRRIWISVAIMAASAAALLCANRSANPKFKGKTVTEWMEVSIADYDITTNRQIRLMLGELGSNSVPPLLRGFRSADSWTDSLIVRAYTNGLMPKVAMAWASTNVLRSWLRTRAYAQALQLLGHKASAAVPELESLLCNPRHGRAGFMVPGILEKVGQEALPALIRALTNAPPNRRILIVDSLGRIWRGIEQAEPVLLALLNDPDQWLKFQVALALSKLSSPPRQAIPILAEALEQSRYRQDAIRALENYVPAHPEALEAIQTASKSEDEKLRRLARASLWHMANPNVEVRP